MKIILFLLFLIFSISCGSKDTSNTSKDTSNTSKDTTVEDTDTGEDTTVEDTDTGEDTACKKRYDQYLDCAKVRIKSRLYSMTCNELVPKSRTVSPVEGIINFCKEDALGSYYKNHCEEHSSQIGDGVADHNFVQEFYENAIDRCSRSPHNPH